MFQVPGFDSWDKYRLLSHGPTSPYQMFHLSPLWMPTSRKTLLCPGWQGMSYVYVPVNSKTLECTKTLLTTKLLVNIKTQCFYSCLILTENFLGNIQYQTI